MPNSKESNGNGSSLKFDGSNGSTTSTGNHEATWVHEIFQGILTSETRCLNCETVSVNFPNFVDYFLKFTIINIYRLAIRRRTFLIYRLMLTKTQVLPIVSELFHQQKPFVLTINLSVMSVALTK